MSLLAVTLALTSLTSAASGDVGRAVPPVSAVRSVAADDSLVVSTTWLESRLSDPNVVVIEVVDALGKRTDRIPGSREMWYRHMTVNRDSLSTELPTTDSLKSLFEGLGISDGSRVVVYAKEAPMATRLLMTLTYIGHDRVSYLDGGLPQWTADRLPVTQEDGPPLRGAITVRARPGMIVNADWITARHATSTLRLIDTRTLGEYNGTGNRSGMPSAGHLAGARNLEWEWLFREDQPLKLKDRAALLKLYGDNIAPTDQVVTYCWVGYRASATWFAAKVLGFDAKFYDGSYQDWQRRKLPVTTGDAR